MKWHQRSLTVSLKSVHRWSPLTVCVCMINIHHPTLRRELSVNVRIWVAQVMGTKVMPLTFFNSPEQFYLNYMHCLYVVHHFLVLAWLVIILFLCFWHTILKVFFFFLRIRMLCINQLLIKILSVCFCLEHSPL